MINFDLHIHSFASNYKEGTGIVKNSTIENAEVLMEKLQEYDVGLFSITDHNRFWPELYIRLEDLIESGDYPSVKGVLAGVEFDVQMDSEMGKCHIICVFNTHKDHSNYFKIKESIDNDRLEDKNDAYSRERFENLLRSIGLEVILIACQRNSLEQHDGKHRSLSESTMDSEELLMSGYINALEFQKPNVEGILKNNLKDFPKQVSMVMGSDCHDWKYYPNHDSQQGNLEFTHSRGRMLPTFKGLLMAMTSPETRINTIENTNHELYSSFSLNGEDYPLVNGINAIIGENGSGKSSLLKLIHGKTNEAHVKKIVSTNKMLCETRDIDKRLYLGQGDIVARFADNTLFPEDNYLKIDHSDFVKMYQQYSDDLLAYLKNRIKKSSLIAEIENDYFEYDDIVSKQNYYIIIEDSFSVIPNPHLEKETEVKSIINSLMALKKDEYFNEHMERIDEAICLMEKVLNIIQNKRRKIENAITVQNTIQNALMDYSNSIESAMSSQDKRLQDYTKKRNRFIEKVIDAIEVSTTKKVFPETPSVLHGYTSNPKNGFKFNSQAKYHDRNVIDDYYSKMFTKIYSSAEKLQSIDNIDQLVQAVRNCTLQDNLDKQWRDNLKQFFEEICQCNNYIVDPSNGDEELGGTLGELSLAYFKYEIHHGDNKNIYLIDQPEDHISNNNISAKLLALLNTLRKNCQIIIVTHNPLLVVNLDVDQVIFLKKKGERISAITGCLEQEGENQDILNIIADNMDGGRDSIEKRLKVYG